MVSPARNPDDSAGPLHRNALGDLEPGLLSTLFAIGKALRTQSKREKGKGAGRRACRGQPGSTVQPNPRVYETFVAPLGFAFGGGGPQPLAIDLDIDSDNNNGFGPPDR